MYDIVHVKAIKREFFLLKNNSYSWKIYVFNINTETSIQTYFFKFSNICKFIQVRKNSSFKWSCKVLLSYDEFEAAVHACYAFYASQW